jgi:hypothetical protein
MRGGRESVHRQYSRTRLQRRRLSQGVSTRELNEKRPSRPNVCAAVAARGARRLRRRRVRSVAGYEKFAGICLHLFTRWHTAVPIEKPQNICVKRFPDARRQIKSNCRAAAVGSNPSSGRVQLGGPRPPGADRRGGTLADYRSDPVDAGDRCPGDGAGGRVRLAILRLARPRQIHAGLGALERRRCRDGAHSGHRRFHPCGHGVAGVAPARSFQADRVGFTGGSHRRVVAFDWKWLFIYPQLRVATVNEIAFPVDVPVAFRVTSASVMNSFFIPRLGSQIYAMGGMQTKAQPDVSMGQSMR